MHLTASQLVINNHPIERISSTHATEDTRCGICGGAIASGEACDDLALPKSFTNQNDLVNLSADYRCTGCASVMADKRFQMQLSSVVITKEAIFPFAKKVDRGFFLLHPPKPPFVMAVGVSKQQHVVWRAPVNYNNSRFVIQLGDERVAIRHSTLMAAVDAVKTIHSSDINGLTGLKKKVRPDSSPFSFSNMKSARCGQSEWYPWALLLREGGHHKSEFDALDQLTPDEAWALDFCLADNLTSPEPFTV